MSCTGCGAPLVYTGLGRPRIYCDRCRSVALRSYHKRKHVRGDVEREVGDEWRPLENTGFESQTRS